MVACSPLFLIVNFPENMPPLFDISDKALRVNVGEDYPSLLDVKATDAEGDSITLSLAPGSPQGLALNGR